MRRRTSAVAAVNVPRLGLATVVALAALVFWVLAVFGHVSSAIVAAEAKSAADAGQSLRAIDLYSAARDLDPSAAINHLDLGQALFTAGRRQADPQEQQRLLEAAYQEIQAVLARNPLDARAWARGGEIQTELSLVRREPMDDAVRDNLVLTALLPGMWQAQVALALSYVRLGRFQEGLEAVEVAKELSATSSNKPEIYFIHYVEAAALRGLGRREEAIAAALRSMAAQSNAASQRLIEQLTDESSP